MRYVLWFGFLAILDVALSAGVAALSPEWQRGQTFVISLLGLWIIPVVVGLWFTLKFWLGYWLFNKRNMVRYLKAQFHQNDFPSAAGQYDCMTYLSFILDDDPEYSSQKAKMKAAFFVGEITTLKNTRPFTMGFATQRAFEQAMDEYKPERRQ